MNYSNYVPFNTDLLIGTGAQNLKDGKSEVLHSHTLDCGNKPFNQLKLTKPNDSQIEWRYKCANGGNLGNSVAKATPLNDYGNGNSIYLDRHDADCGANSVMTKLRLNNSSIGAANNQIQWQYSCATSTQPLRCRNVTTTPNTDGGGNIISLEKHDIKCNADEAISKIQLVRPTDSQIQFKYTCCN